MAARRSPKQRAEVAKFIDELFETSTSETWAEFASAAGVHWASLSDWHTGKSVPDGYNLLRLIRAAGVSPEAVTQLADGHDLESLLGRLEGLASVLRQAAANLAGQSEPEVAGHRSLPVRRRGTQVS